MKKVAFSGQCRLSALAFLLMAGTAVAQTPPAVQVQSLDPAVRLAANMRELGRNPNSVSALTGAGESALAVGDAEAAFNFLSRAQELSPIDGRVKLLLGATLNQMMRPADALVLLNEARTLGYDPQAVLKERGLSYDLQGDQKRAQRDYQDFLRNGVDDEVTRRFALSLGIGGERDKALQLLNPLIRQRDQSAWRARTFILAMSGNLREADEIAGQVMPSDNGGSLKPFLRKLAVLSPAQQAAATNYGIMPEEGSMGTTVPTRVAMADPSAALTPTGPPMGSVSPTASMKEGPSWKADDRPQRKSRKDRKQAEVIPIVTPPAGPTPPPVDASRPGFAIDTPPPQIATRPVQIASLPPVIVRQPVPATTPTKIVSPPTSGVAQASTGRVASRVGPVDPERVPADLRQHVPSIANPVAEGPSAKTPASVTQIAALPTTLSSLPAPETVPTTPVVRPVSSPVVPEPAPAAPTAVAPVVPIIVAAALPSQMANQTVAPDIAKPVTQSVIQPAAPAAPSPGFSTTTTADAAEQKAGSPAPSEVIPVERPGIDPAQTGATPVVSSTQVASVETPLAAPTVEQSAVSPSPTVAVTPPVPAEPSVAGLSGIIASLTPEEQSAAAPLPSDEELRAARIAARKKEQAEATAKLEADKKKKELEAKKAEAEKEKAAELAKAKANPARTWVQIATGGNKAGLAGTVRSIRTKAPKAMGSLSGWYAPVRSTFRILVGPVKSAGEAKTIVAALAKEGIQANSWSSAAGEDVFRIGK